MAFNTQDVPAIILALATLTTSLGGFIVALRSSWVSQSNAKKLDETTGKIDDNSKKLEETTGKIDELRDTTSASKLTLTLKTPDADSDLTAKLEALSQQIAETEKTLAKKTLEVADALAAKRRKDRAEDKAEHAQERADDHRRRVSDKKERARDV